MRLLSVNVGLPRQVGWHGATVTTGIFKEPLQSSVMLRKLNLDGDRQADLSVHGGEHKAVYAYPIEHYGYWRRELPGMELPFGMFGENFTIEGLMERDVNIGDRFQVGAAELASTQPRLPCHKLGIKFGRDDMVKRFLASGRTGLYFSVAREGQVTPGDEIRLIEKGASQLTIPDITRLYVSKNYSPADLKLLRHASQAEALPESWRRYFAERLEREGPAVAGA